MMDAVSDADDPRIAAFVGLRRDDIKDPAATTCVAEGRLCVRRLVESGLPVHCILVQDGRQDEAADWTNHRVPIFHANRKLLQQITGFPFHRGFLALGDRPASADVGGFVDSMAGSSALALAAWGVSQRDNLGTMIRTAAALGIGRVVLDPSAADPFSRRAIRTSMAAVFRQRMFMATDSVADLARIRAAGIRTIATTIDPAATPLEEFSMGPGPMMLLIGNEADGLPQAVQSAATDRVRIPMHFDVDSLNAAIAAAICMYHLSRRR